MLEVSTFPPKIEALRGFPAGPAHAVTIARSDAAVRAVARRFDLVILIPPVLVLIRRSSCGALSLPSIPVRAWRATVGRVHRSPVAGPSGRRPHRPAAASNDETGRAAA